MLSAQVGTGYVIRKTLWIPSNDYPMTYCPDCLYKTIGEFEVLASGQSQDVFWNVLNSVWFLLVACFLIFAVFVLEHTEFGIQGLYF